MTTLLNFISDTHQDLTDTDFSDDASWQLVTQLVNNIFNDDMNKVRCFFRKSMNTHSKEDMAAAVLVGTFQTHRVMEEYMKYGIDNHTSISSEYVKFLMTNSSSRGETSGGGDKLDGLEERMTEVEKVAKGVKSSAGSAYNAVDQLKKKVEKIENRKREVGAIQVGENSSDKARIVCELETLVQVDTSSDVVIISEGWPIWICVGPLVWDGIN